MTCGLNEVADLEGLEDEDHDAACEVAERALQSKTDSHTGRGDHGHDRGHGNAENGDHGHDHHDVERDVEEVHQEACHGDLGLLHSLGLANDLHDEFDEEVSDNESENGADQLAANVGGECDEIIPQGLQSFFHR